MTALGRKGFVRRLRLVGLLAAGLAFTTGCQGLYGLALPGAVAATGRHQTITVVFDNVANLVPDSAVKVDDITVGSVTKITLTKDFKARVVCRILPSVHLPANTVAVLNQTSLLGEKFVQLGPPPGQAPYGQLPSGAVIGDGNSTAYPDLEEVFGALSDVLNGGGLANLQTISVELAKALGGREERVRDLLRQLDTFVGGLNTQRGQIVRAIDQLDRLTGELAAQRSSIATALDNLGPGIAVLADERSQLTSMLSSLSRLGVVSTRIINASRENTIADLNQLRPVLGKLAEAGQSLPHSLELLFDYPFPKDSVAGIPGDYTNLYATLDANSVCNLLPPGTPAGLCLFPQTPGGGGGLKLPSGTAQKSSGGGLLQIPQNLLPSPTPLPIPTPSLPGGLGGILKGELP